MQFIFPTHTRTRRVDDIEGSLLLPISILNHLQRVRGPFEMGKSAKVHKRAVRPHASPWHANLGGHSHVTTTHGQKKTTGSASASASTLAAPPSQSKPQSKSAHQQQTAVASAAKKSRLLKGTRGKNKAATSGGSSGASGGGASRSSGHVLGGADYVDIVMGSRRREREEAQKLPPRE